MVPQEIEYLLEDHCWKCHDDSTGKGDVRLDNLGELDLDSWINLLNRMHEQTHLEIMPPKKERSKPSADERQKLVDWIAGNLEAQNASTLGDKLRSPGYANYVDHDKLFSGKYADLIAYAPDRKWLISEYIFDEKFNRILELKQTQRIDGKLVSVVGGNIRKGVNLANPFKLQGDAGVRYYDTTTLDGGHLLTMMTNAREASNYMMKLSRNGRYLPTVHKIMEVQWQRRDILEARQEFVGSQIGRLLEDIYQGRNDGLFPEFVPVTVKASSPIPLNQADKLPSKKKRKKRKDPVVEAIKKAPGSEVMYRSYLKHQASAKSKEDLIRACERDWFNYGDNAFVIQNRVAFLHTFMEPWLKHMAKDVRAAKNRKAGDKPLPKAEIEVIRETILKLRKQGDTGKVIVSKCKDHWEEGLKRQQISEGLPDEETTHALVSELFIKILEREPDAKELVKYGELSRNYFKAIGKGPGIEKLIGTILLSSEFVYRSEFGVGKADEHRRRMLSPRDASYAISYALTDSSPDEKLAEAARAGRLNTRDDYKREVERILKKRRDFYTIDTNLLGKHGERSITQMPIRELRFFRDFFGYPKMYSIFKDNKRFGGPYIQSQARILSEADLLVEHIMEKDQNVIEELLTTEKFYVFHNGDNEAMAAASDNFRAIYDYIKDKDWKNFTEEDFDVHRPALEKLGMKRLSMHKSRLFSDMMASITEHFEKGLKHAPPQSFHLIGPYGLDKIAAVRSYNIDLANWDYPQTQPVALPNRKGILTHPAWLIAYARNTESDPIHRGKWVRERLLAGTIPKIPITVDAVIPEDHTKTLRSRVASATEATYCWTCHEGMNPLGYPFEMYDDFGRFRLDEPLEHPDNLIEKMPNNGPLKKDFRDLYKTLPVDASGHLAGTDDEALDGDVTDSIDMIERLAKSDKVRQSVIRHAFRYFMGRNETLSDSRTLIEADQAYLKSGGSFDAVIVSLLTSDSFIFHKPAEP